MLNKPKFMIPSTNKEECIIDASANPILFSCFVDGNEAIGAWQIKVYSLNDNTLILDTGVQILSPFFFPIDNKNRNKIFEVNLKKYLEGNAENYNYIESYFPATSMYDETKKYYKITESGGSSTYTEYEYTTATQWRDDYPTLFYKAIFSNSPNLYYWTIDFWSSSCVETDSENGGLKLKDNCMPTTRSCETVFYANSIVKTEILYGVENIIDGKMSIEYSSLTDSSLTEGIVLNSNKYYFKASYDQAEGVCLKRYGWRIKDIASDVVLLDTISDNQIYGTSDNITCSYDGFLNGGDYSVEVQIETQNGAITTSSFEFAVVYETTYLTNDFKVTALPKQTAIMLDWGDASVIGGKQVGNISYISQYPIVNYNTQTPSTSVIIPDESSVVFDYGATSNLHIPETSVFVISIQLEDNSKRLLFSAEGVESGKSIFRRLTFDGVNFVYEIMSTEGNINSYKSDNFSPTENKWYIITLFKDGLRVVQSIAENGQYPSEISYPSTDKYPSFGTWDKLSTTRQVRVNGI